MEPRRSRRALPAIAWLLAAATITAVATSLALVLAEPGRWSAFLAGGHADAPFTGVLGTFFGALLVTHRPRNAVGWLLLLSSAMQGCHVVANEHAVHALVYGGASATTGAVVSFLAPLTLIAAAGPLVLLILVFPDGRLPTLQHRVVAALTVADIAVALAVDAVVTWPLRGTMLLDGTPDRPALASGHPALAVTELATLFVALAAVAVAARSYRRAGGVARHQLKWFVTGFGLVVVLVALSHLLPQPAGGLVAVLSPHPGIIAVYIAVRRHRLYDIDRIVSRGVAYLLLTGAVVAVYLLSATLLAWAFGRFAGGGTLAVAGSAVVAAAVFNPARRRFQDLGDRAFRRRAYHARRVIGGYIDGLAVAEPRPGALREVAAAALGDTTAAVALWLPRERRYVDEHGEQVEPHAGAGRLLTPVEREGAHLGLLIHRRPAAGEDPSLAQDVARAAVVAFAHARLRAMVLTQLAEVRASRSRIVAAGDDQRRRIERDLHDGAQQRLLAIALELSRLEQASSSRSGEALAGRLRELAEEAQRAVTELRELTHGLVPPVLADRGLAAAVETLAERSLVPVSVEAALDREPAPAAQAAAYYVAAEALTNVARHARASRVHIVVATEGETLTVTVEDDGAGGADPARGTGLLGLRDRVEAAGGRLVVCDRDGGGTCVRAELPEAVS